MNKILNYLRANWQDILKPVTVLLVICVIISFALSLTNNITATKIEGLEKKTQEDTMSLLVDADRFDERTSGDNGSKNTFQYFVAVKNEHPVAYIFVTSAKGYGGEVSVMTAVDTEGAVKEVAILDVLNETPGLGQNAKNESFYSQFKDKINDVILVKNSADSENNEINAVTGATITSKAVTNAVNEALDRWGLVSSFSSLYNPDEGEEITESTAEEVEAVEEQ